MQYIPLSEKLRPKSLKDYVGQDHILSSNSILRKALENKSIFNCVFYGPPGTGKTSLTNIISNTFEGVFYKLNASHAGVSDIKKILDKAQFDKEKNIQTYLILECIEKGDIIFIGTTTENPYIALNRAVISRCKLFPFKELNSKNILSALIKALQYIKNEQKSSRNIDLEVLEYISEKVNGDLRMAYSYLETLFNSTNKEEINMSDIEILLDEKIKTISTTDSYDLLSAFCKSLRGSDSDAALYYAHRLIYLGEDPLTILRRLIVHASEDVGLANSNALQVATSALIAHKNIGLPESLICISHAIIYVSESPKSNTVITSIKNLKEDIKKDLSVPNHLKNHKTDFEISKKYLYPHDYKDAYVKQQYLPDELKHKEYYIPKQNGLEKAIIKRKLKKDN